MNKCFFFQFLLSKRLKYNQKRGKINLTHILNDDDNDDEITKPNKHKCRFSVDCNRTYVKFLRITQIEF